MSTELEDPRGPAGALASSGVPVGQDGVVSATESDSSDGEILRGAAKTRAAIADAARELFSTQEYAETSVRAIAAKAGADPALVIRYFASKEALFLETVRFTGFYGQTMGGPLEGMGERIVRAQLSGHLDSTFAAYRAMVRASASEVVRERLLDAVNTMFVGPIAPRLEGPDAPLRARLIAAQIAGLIDFLAVLEDGSLRGVDVGTLSRVYGAALQTLIDPPA